ncbi:glycosyltransferase family 25 protein [Pseudotabrizicola algicola]|uniref:Glycosyltransferase family 25 protein n=1 Tax=Pseudotabrizicola algicola TaxID=2709381 RepID=A0A6B3RIE0_9RHOB|nr:glycosyltransferase family 25 protein [Pseudotabrizicola algicola]NEX45780.1 glycosyltransferase family 25 protein [Pseudotabrizicola algicola]
MTPPAALTRADLGIWLINLPRSADRRARMVAQLQALGLDYTLFDAVDGRAEWERLKSSVDLPAFRANVGREVLPGEIGCYHSHLGVWQALLASPHKAALVLEDDVVFHDDFLPALDLALAHADRWDMLKLNKIRAKFPVGQGALGAYRLNAFVGSFTGMGAYLVTRACAQDLLPALLPIRRPIDHALDRIDLRHFRHFALQPFPSHVDDGNQSTITGSGFAEVKKFPWYRRPRVYQNRLGALIAKGSHLLLGRIITPPAPGCTRSDR